MKKKKQKGMHNYKQEKRLYGKKKKESPLKKPELTELKEKSVSQMKRQQKPKNRRSDKPKPMLMLKSLQRNIAKKPPKSPKRNVSQIRNIGK